MKKEARKKIEKTITIIGNSIAILYIVFMLIVVPILAFTGA